MHYFQIKKEEFKKLYPHLYFFSLGYVDDWDEEEVFSGLLHMIKNKIFSLEDIEELIIELRSILSKKSDEKFIIEVSKYMFAKGKGVYENSLNFMLKLLDLLEKYSESYKQSNTDYLK